MALEMFDKVLLNTGEVAYIVEVFENGEAYLADIDKEDGWTETEEILPSDIKKVLRRASDVFGKKVKRYDGGA